MVGLHLVKLVVESQVWHHDTIVMLHIQIKINTFAELVFRVVNDRWSSGHHMGRLDLDLISNVETEIVGVSFRAATYIPRVLCRLLDVVPELSLFRVWLLRSLAVLLRIFKCVAELRNFNFCFRGFSDGYAWHLLLH